MAKKAATRKMFTPDINLAGNETFIRDNGEETAIKYIYKLLWNIFMLDERAEREREK